MKPNVIIVGAGLTGLSLALSLKERSVSSVILEASDRIGGRIYSEGGYDMGPAWFWPGQPRILSLLKKLNLDYYQQQDDGHGIYQTQANLQRITQGYMPASYRVRDGLGALATALSDAIGQQNIHLNQNVQRVVNRNDSKIEVFTKNKGDSYIADNIVIAVPPRVVVNSMTFRPELPADLHDEMQNIPTWMAGSAKALVKYDVPFWHKSKFSGTAFSQLGPLVQIHEATLQGNKDEFALFGFIGNIPLKLRNDENALTQSILAQLAALFGEQAYSYKALIIKDWLKENYVTTAQDKVPLNEHPEYGLSRTNLWDNKLIFAGTETVTEHGGLLEGALVSAERVIEKLEYSGLC